MKFLEPKTFRGSTSPVTVVRWVVGIGTFEYPTGRPRRGMFLYWSGIILIFFVYIIQIATLENVWNPENSPLSKATHQLFLMDTTINDITIVYLVQGESSDHPLAASSFLSVIFCNRAKMKFLEPRTLRDAMSPVILVSWLFALGIFEYPIGHPRILISLCWSVAQFFLFMTFLILSQSSDLMKAPSAVVSTGVYRLFTCVNIVSVIVFLYFGRATSKHIVASLRKLNEVNKMLSKYKIPKEYGLTFKYQIIQLTAGFLLMLIVLAIKISWITYAHHFRITYLGYFAVGLYIPTCHFIVNQTFTSFIGYIGNRFQHLNANLVRYSFQENNYTNSFLQGLEFDGSFRPTTLGIDANPHFLSLSDKQWMVKLVSNSRKIHQELCRTARIINEAFGIQILLSMTTSSVLVTSLFYGIYNIFAASTSMWTYNSTIKVIIIVLWLIFYLTKIFYTISVCSTTSAQAQRMGELIHQLDKPIADGNIREEIHAFSLLLMQNPLRFTASGFFMLDYQMLRGMVGTVTTYLVIMIQLHSTYDSAFELTNDTHSATNSTYTNIVLKNIDL